MTDIFRKDYRPLSEEQKSWMIAFKNQAQSLYDDFENCSCEHDKRMMALAKTNLEQAVMWAIKAIT